LIELRRSGRLAAAIALACALPAAAADPAAQAASVPAAPVPAAGGVHLFQALERSQAPVVATVRERRALDAESFAAVFEVELVLAGELARGTRLPVAWEELSRGRPPRFADGERVLVALEPLAGGSIWRQRIPDPAALAATFSVAEQGDAFVRSPSTGEAQLALHFLALPPELRDGNPGAAHLVRLAQSGSPGLAGAALERLARVPGLDRVLDPTSADRLVAVLLREPPLLREAALALVEQQRLESLRAPLSRLAAPDASGPAPVYEAIARLDGPLSAPLTAALLGRDTSADHRLVGARHAAPDAAERLARLVRLDPAPAVRAAAVERLVEIGGVGEIDRVLFALGDPEQEVRARAMLAIGELGGDAVPALRRVADSGQPEAARTAVGALEATGPEGMRALAEIADTHPDESVRQLARIALGRPVGHVH
jgi:hypothetical protein